jgi:hypothetical protein
MENRDVRILALTFVLVLAAVAAAKYWRTLRAEARLEHVGARVEVSDTPLPNPPPRSEVEPAEH